MTLSDFATFSTAIAVVGGMIFGGWQLRLAARERSTQVSLHLMETLHSPELTEGLVALLEVPDGCSRKQLKEHLGDQWKSAWLVFFTMDGLGLLVYRGEIHSTVADDFFRHSVALAWAKFQGAIKEIRGEWGNPTVGEWLQWLAETQTKRHMTPRIPAYEMAEK